MTQYITRKTHFAYGHRVLQQNSACFYYHGHESLVELTYSFNQVQDLGYPVDFKEIKRVHCAWIDDHLDHGFLANPEDEGIIQLCHSEKSRLWTMSLEDGAFCNPTCEHISREIFLAVDILTEQYPLLELYNVRLYETPNCFTDCRKDSIPDYQRFNFRKNHYESIKKYGETKGVLEYDRRKSGERLV